MWASVLLMTAGAELNTIHWASLRPPPLGMRDCAASIRRPGAELHSLSLTLAIETL